MMFFFFILFSFNERSLQKNTEIFTSHLKWQGFPDTWKMHMQEMNSQTRALLTRRLNMLIWMWQREWSNLKMPLLIASVMDNSQAGKAKPSRDSAVWFKVLLLANPFIMIVLHYLLLLKLSVCVCFCVSCTLQSGLSIPRERHPSGGKVCRIWGSSVGHTLTAVPQTESLHFGKN